jgi:hypothetical protein
LPELYNLVNGELAASDLRKQEIDTDFLTWRGGTIQSRQAGYRQFLSMHPGREPVEVAPLEIEAVMENGVYGFSWRLTWQQELECITGSHSRVVVRRMNASRGPQMISRIFLR